MVNKAKIIVGKRIDFEDTSLNYRGFAIIDSIVIEHQRVTVNMSDHGVSFIDPDRQFTHGLPVSNAEYGDEIDLDRFGTYLIHRQREVIAFINERCGLGGWLTTYAGSPDFGSKLRYVNQRDPDVAHYDEDIDGRLAGILTADLLLRMRTASKR